MSLDDQNTPIGARLNQVDGKVVAVVGCGRAGIAATSLLLKLGAKTHVFDDALKSVVAARLQNAGVSVDDICMHCGDDAAESGEWHAFLQTCHLLVLSPGVPRTHSLVYAAVEAGVPVVNEIELAAAQLQSPTVVVVTGTNGKSTTTSMLGTIMRLVDPDVFVGGNLGTPLCEVVAAGEHPATLILELSSYQLETIRSLNVRVAVVTNLSPDHLDRYDNNPNLYYATKARVFDLLTSQGVACLNRGDVLSRGKLNPSSSIKRLDFDVPDGGEGVSIGTTVLTMKIGHEIERVEVENERIVGHHNRQNAAAACAAAAALGVPAGKWREGLKRFEGIPHRLQYLGSTGGVRWFNDSKATNVDAAMKAVESFSSGIHLIVGGQGKGASYAPLVEVARGRLAALYTIGEDAPALAAAFAGTTDVSNAETLECAVEQARACAQNDQVILLAPACASFDQFKSFVVRGQAFAALFEMACFEESSIQESGTQKHTTDDTGKTA